MTELLEQRQPAIRVIPMPSDTNAFGDIFGGWIMSQVDIAGSVVAARRARGCVVTVAVKEFQFHQPVFVGDLMSCYADVVRVGRTSLTVFVEVFVERAGVDAPIKVTEATVTYVAVGEDRRPRAVDSAS